MHGNYLNYIKTTPYTTISRTPGYNGDSATEFRFPIVDIVHNDITQQKTWEELTRRINNFNIFKQKVLTDPNYYFVYSINYYDVDRQSHLMNRKIFIENLEYLKKEGLLNKIVFMETRNKDENAFWNFYAINIQDLIKKYNWIYIQINDLTLGAPDEDIIMPQFYKKAIEAIKMKGNK